MSFLNSIEDIYSLKDNPFNLLQDSAYLRLSEYVPYFLKDLKEKIDTMPEIFEED